ncbi:MAG: hypothetical protein IJP48_03420 [Synergistaceae bacterium]|nr:hypothetical protein [Synergistaceae bacterium]
MDNRIIELEPQEVTKELFDRAQFFHCAGSGAMGDAGAVVIVTDDGKTYYCNYVHGKVTADQITKAFPVWSKSLEKIEKDCVFYYLGMGNELLVRKKHQKAFETLANGNLDDLYLYKNWHKFAVEICSKSCYKK